MPSPGGLVGNFEAYHMQLQQYVCGTLRGNITSTRDYM